MIVCVRAVREKDLFCCCQVHLAGDKESIYEEGDRKVGGSGGGANRMLDEQMRKVAKQIFQNRRSRGGGRCHTA